MQTEAEPDHAQVEEHAHGQHQTCDGVQPAALEGSGMSFRCDDGILVDVYQHVLVASGRQVLNGLFQYLRDMLYGMVVARTEEYLDGTGPAQQVVYLRVVAYLRIDTTQ